MRRAIKKLHSRLALCLATAIAPPALAQDTTGGSVLLRPDRASRVIAVYDFEEPRNPFEVPGQFFRAQSDPTQGIDRPGYPIFNRAEFDTDYARSGERSVRLPITRGSVSLRLRPGALPIFADADYRVDVSVRADRLEHARFRLVARLLDDRGRPIEGAQWVGEPALPSQDWQTVSLSIQGGRYAGAAFLQVDAEAVQPELYRTDSLEAHQVWPQDFNTAVWIDDLRVTQLPRMMLAPAEPSAVFLLPQRPELRLMVRDLAGEALRVRLTTRDHLGRLVDRQTGPVRSSRTPSIWQPDVPRLGWYRSIAQLEADGTVIMEAATSFIVRDGPASPPDAMGGYPTAEQSRFGLAVTRNANTLVTMLPELAARVRSQGLTIEAWTPDLEPGTIARRAERFSELLRSTNHAWSEPGVALGVVPLTLREDLVVDPDGVIDTLRREPEQWGGYLEPMLERVGDIARRWRLGDGRRVSQTTLDLLGGSLPSIRNEFSVLVPGPRIEPAWPASLGFGPIEAVRDSVAGVAVLFSVGTGSDAVRDAVERFANADWAPDSELALVFDSSPSGVFVGAGAAGELVKRLVTAEAARADAAVSMPRVVTRYELRDPWSIEPRSGAVAPHPTLAAWAASVDRMTGRHIAADLGFVPGTRVYLLTPTEGHTEETDPGGALVAWNESADPDEAVVQLNLGSEPVTLVDIWGNRSRPIAPMQQDLGQGRSIEVHRIQLGPDPVFIEGIDVDLALLTASIRLDEPVLQATAGPHERSIILTNPWPVAIDGDLILVEPNERSPDGSSTGWDISPRVKRFSAGPGQTIRVPVELSFARFEPSGPKPVIVDVILRSGPVQERIRASSTLDIRLDGVELVARIVRAESGSTDLALEALITNTTTNPLDLAVLSSAPGYPRQSAAVVQLAPGASTMRRFAYPAGSERLSGRVIYVGVDDPARQGRLNISVPVEPNP
ncbi:MAG: hypothetical protein AAGB48_12010 [Planctomycetota bacterium]